MWLCSRSYSILCLPLHLCLFFSHYVAALQSGHTAFSSFLFFSIFWIEHFQRRLYANRRICVVQKHLLIFDQIAKQVRSMNWRKPSVCLSVCLSVVNNLLLTVAFSLVSHKPLMIHKSNFVSLFTLMSSSRPIQNLVTLTLTSRFSEHALILTLACFWMALKVWCYPVHTWCLVGL